MKVDRVRKTLRERLEKRAPREHSRTTRRQADTDAARRLLMRRRPAAGRP
jgi:hypothetical protein